MDQTNNNIGQNNESKCTFTPQQAHIFGGQSIFLSFADTHTPLAPDFFYYIIFEGSNLRHITSAKVLNPYTLQAVIPEHDEAELVILTVGSDINKESRSMADINILASDTFVFTSDSTQFLSQQLANNASSSSELLNIESVYSSLLDIPADDKRLLDAKLTTSFRKIQLPQTWSLATTQPVAGSNWTLLHFCAKHDLSLLAELLMCKKGSEIALKTLDSHGRTPLDISMYMHNKRLTEVLSRIPCEEEVEANSNTEKHPRVTRHKLGTTTISNRITKEDYTFVKDLTILKELDKLAAVSQDSSHEIGTVSSEEPSPLAETLKKLHEINEEIRRLRSIRYKDIDIVQYEKAGEEYPDTNGNFISSPSPTEHYSSTEDPLHEKLLSNKDAVKQSEEEEDSFLDVSNMCDLSNDSFILTTETDQSLNGTELDESSSGFGNSNDEVKNIPDVIYEGTSDTELERKLSSISHGKVDNIDITEVIEVLPTVVEVSLTAENVVTEIQVTNIDGNLVNVNTIGDASTAELNFKLESVTEETEEELQADGSTISRRPRVEHSMSLPQTRSLNDLPPHLPKRVGILKKSEIKYDRPLSDSFENLKMVESQGIVDLYQGGSSNVVAGSRKESSLTRGHSLDALMKDVDVNSEPSTTSQISLNERNDSQDSLTSDYDTPKSRSCSGSDKVSVNSYKATSLLSLPDIPRYSGSSQEDLRNCKKGNLLSKITFKKAKSMSSLEMEKNKIIVQERRKTFTGEFNTDAIPSKPKYPDEQLASYVTFEETGEVKKSQSTYSIDVLSSKDEKDRENSRNRRVSTSNLPKSYDRNESQEAYDFGESKNHEPERKSSTDEKKKNKFGMAIFGGGKPKEKKNKKKMVLPKPELALPDLKAANFLAKRGTSFRQNFKLANDNKSSEKHMFTRGPSTNSNTKQDAANKSLRLSDSRSPTPSRKAIIHEDSNNDQDMEAVPSRTLSGSRTSLESLNSVNDDDTDSAYIPDDASWDSDLDAKDEPETWSELVDKKVQRKMHAKDIKRQDVIYELIQTEAVYLRVLQIMRKIYARGMINSLNMDVETVVQIFPLLDDLIELNGNFVQAMKARQQESPNYCIENIGDILLDFFGGENGEMLKQVYGYFCSRHLEAVALYKELLKNDKKFANYMKQCLLNDRSRRLSIPECITYVTIRMTKYPLLIEAIIKATKESKSDFEQLKTSLSLVKEVLVAVDEAVNIYEQEKELKALRKNLDRKNFVEIKIANQKSVYKTTKLFHKRSRLLYDKKTVLKGKNKSYDTRMIVLAEKIIFFQDNGGGKLQLLSADNKAPVLSLKNLMVREVATDNRALFLVSTSKDAAQIYEIICDSYKDKKDFMPKLQQCIKDCPEEEEENLTDLEEEARREEEERISKLKEIIDHLQRTDDTMSLLMSDKNKIVLEMRELIESMDDVGPIKGSPCSDLKASDVTNARITLESCLNEVNQLTSAVSVQPVDLSILSPSPSPGAVTGATNTSICNIPKRPDVGGMKPSYSFGNVSRTTAIKPLTGRTGVVEPDSGKPKRQSQLLSVLSRTKATGSTEDLTSISSSVSTASISTISSTLSQWNVFQSLKDNLWSLTDVTNKQDIEIGKMRLELQENRADMLKLRAEKKELEDRLAAQQKDSDKQIRHEKEQYAKLAREFKRTTDKLKTQLDEKKTQYQQLLDTYNDLKMGVYNNSKTRTEDGLFV